ncbi:CDP-alcohol phosphatidyltransferase family protein [Candidatus Woesearchaeota archaeon]|nr:CDP-alcohol phosphatidyltransferase family protein [Candidatus Woesearchaeota archaeon]
MLKEKSAHKPLDHLIARLFIRPVSSRIAKLLVDTKVTPNHLTTLSLFYSLASAIFFAFGDYIYLIMGIILYQIGFYIFDNVDGDLARLRGQKSEFGAWYDDIDDRIREVLTFVGLTVGLYGLNQDIIILVIGFIAIINILMVNFLRASTYKFSKKLPPEISLRKDLYFGWTETIVYLTTIFVLINQVYWLLVIYATFGTLAWLKKIHSVYKKHKEGYIS